MWANADTASLPSFSVGGSHLIDAMDEILSFICNPEDVLVTRWPLNAAYRDYIREICGAPAAAISVGSHDGVSRGTSGSTASLLLDACRGRSGAPNVVAGAYRLRPYAVHDDVNELASLLDLPERPPRADAVASVNSKRFSKRTQNELWPDRYPGHHTTHVGELVTIAHELLEQGEIVLKEDFGVSGKGNLRVAGKKVFARVLAHLQRQLDAGKRLSLTVEPLLDRRLDFSCHFDVSSRGVHEFRAVQLMFNQQMSYAGSSPASDELRSHLDALDYLAMMEQVVAAVGQHGYVGPICIDSMLLRDGSLIPVVEINARYSMGRICHELVRRVVYEPARSRLLALRLTTSETLSFERLIDVMERRSLLLRAPGESGICPLTANMLRPPAGGSGGSPRAGRLYALFTAARREQLDAQYSNLIEVLHQMDCRVDNGEPWSEVPLA